MPENMQEMPADPSVGGAPVDTSQISPTAGNAPIADPSMMGGQQQVGPENEAEMKFDLERMMGKVKDKNAAFEERQVLSSEKLEGLKAKIVKEIFSLMKELGVDPADLNSINEFLQKLQQQDPDLYTMFESAINSLSPEAVPGMQGEMEGGMPPEGMPPGMPPGMEGGMPPGMEGGMPPGMPPGMEGEEGGGGGLMENNSTNLQENILRQ